MIDRSFLGQGGGLGGRQVLTDFNKSFVIKTISSSTSYGGTVDRGPFDTRRRGVGGEATH